MKSSTFKIMSVITFACFLFPIFDILGVFAKAGPIGYFALIGGILGSLLCFLLANIFNTDSKGLAIVTVAVISGIASAAIMFGTKTSILLTAIIFIYIFFVGYVGFKAFSKELAGTLSKKKIVTMILIMFGALAVSLMNFSYMVNEMFAALVIAMIASMFILNRSLLEALYKRKSSDGTDVSKLVQKYNLFIITGFAIVFAILFFAKDIVAFLIRYGLELAGLSVLTMMKKTNNESFKVDDTSSNQLNISSGLKIEANQYASQINTIMFYAMIVIVSIVLIIVIVKLIKYAPSKIQLFLQKLKDFFARMMGLSQVGVRVASKDFVDEVENIDKDDLDDERRMKMLRNQRKVRSIKDPVERMRAFYAYFMNTLKRNNVPLFVSDTSYQIYNKSHLVCDVEDITKQVTEIYNQVRYNDTIPDEKTLDSVDEYMTVITKNCKAIKVVEEDKKDRKNRGRR